MPAKTKGGKKARQAKEKAKKAAAKVPTIDYDGGRKARAVARGVWDAVRSMLTQDGRKKAKCACGERMPRWRLIPHIRKCKKYAEAAGKKAPKGVQTSKQAEQAARAAASSGAEMRRAPVPQPRKEQKAPAGRGQKVDRLIHRNTNRGGTTMASNARLNTGDYDLSLIHRFAVAGRQLGDLDPQRLHELDEQLVALQKALIGAAEGVGGFAETLDRVIGIDPRVVDPVHQVDGHLAEAAKAAAFARVALRTAYAAFFEEHNLRAVKRKGFLDSPVAA